MLRSAVASTWLVCLAVSDLQGQSVAPASRAMLPQAPHNPVGRTVFRLDEPIRLHARLPDLAEDATVTWRFTGEGGGKRLAKTLVAGGRTGFVVDPYALGLGGWHVSLDELPDAVFALRVVSGVPNTPFVVNLYGGLVPDDGQQLFGGPPPMPTEQRLALWKHTYGINHLMTIGRPGGTPPEPRHVDRALLLGASITTQHSVAGQHQPGGTSTDWSDPGVLKACRYEATHVAQRWPRYVGPAFRGVHYADEPGLTWGLGNEDGTMKAVFGGEKGFYVGSLTVPLQYELYAKLTGRTPPDWRDPLARYDEWLEFQRFRSTILGDVFARLTRDVKRIDPGLIGYSQVYAWRSVSGGIYPPETAKGLDVLSTHGYAMWTWLGHAYPAHEVDALRSGAWDKPLWYLGPWLGHQAETGGVRAVLYGLLARKVEGITWPIDWMQHWPEAAEVSRRILPVSAALALAAKPREGVALLHSLDQHHRCVAENWKDGAFPDRRYEGRLMSAWWGLMAAGHPANRVVEEELLSGTAKDYRVVVAPGLTHVRPVVREALGAYIRGGGTVLLDADSTLDLPGAQKLPFAFPDGFDPKILPHTGTVRGPNQRLAFDTLVEPHREALRRALRPLVPPLVETDDPHLLLGHHVGGEARYYWIVNNRTVRDEKRQFVPVPTHATVSIPAGGGTVYDLFAQKPLKEPVVELDLAEGDARLFAVLPRPVAAVALDEPAWDAPYLSVRAAVRDAAGLPLPAVVPLELELTAPDGRRVGRFYRATRGGEFVERWPLGRAPAAGEYVLRATERMSGRSVVRKVAVVPDRDVALGSAIGPVEVFDASRIADVLQPGRELLILVGDRPHHEAEARRLAAALAGRKVRARIEPAARYDAKDRLDDPRVKGQIFPFFNGVYNYAVGIHEDVVLLGGVADNPLMHRLVRKYDLCPWKFADDEPGPGRAVVWWAAAAFGLEHRIVAVAANDAPGLRRGVDAVLAVPVPR